MLGMSEKAATGFFVLVMFGVSEEVIGCLDPNLDCLGLVSFHRRIEDPIEGASNIEGGLASCMDMLVCSPEHMIKLGPLSSPEGNLGDVLQGIESGSVRADRTPLLVLKGE
jgi:hypothetical protein